MLTGVDGAVQLVVDCPYKAGKWGTKIQPRTGTMRKMYLRTMKMRRTK